ncbi:4-hydroxy-tetrahydrodipicolinate synthase [Mycoplasmatota bacterium]|nr:4-hydroxy-tetrahydrodipicolinate synthase [Mycoplasmatota bacterium]
MVFGKIITAMVTPFDMDDNINLDTLKKLVEHLIKNNTSCILLSGTTGESPTLTDIEKIVLFEKTLEYVDNRIPVIAGIGTNSTKKTIDFIKKVEYLPLSGYLVVVPYYNKPDQEGMYQHFKTIAQNTKKPIIIYNIPSRTGVDMEYKTIKKLAKISNIVGIKESNKNVDKIKKIKEEIKDFKAYVGDDTLLYDALKHHVDGIVSVASHIYGKSIHHIIQLMRTKQYNDALAIFNIYYPKFEALFIKPNPVPLKAALNHLGFNVGSVRLPLVDMSEEIKNELYSILRI